MAPVAGPVDTDAAGPPRPPDELDRRLIRLLQQDGRMSVRALAEAVHISRASAYARLTRLVEDGVISGFGARVDPERLGFATSAYITLEIEQNSWRTVREQLLELPGVEHMALVSGGFDVVLLVRAVDNRALRELVFQHIQPMRYVRSTRTLLIFDESDRGPTLP